MKIKLNTNLCPIVNVGMYDSYISLGSRLEDTDYNVERSDNITEEEKNYYYENGDCDTERYKKDVAEIAIKHIKVFFDDIRHIISVKVCDEANIDSPRWYNYRTDELDFEIEIEDSEINKIIEAVQDVEAGTGFFEWAYDTYKSYDGFISFMPYRKDEFMEGIQDPNSSDFDRALAMYFIWLLKETNAEMEMYDERFTVYQMLFQEDVFEETFAEGYLVDERCHEILRKVG